MSQTTRVRLPLNVLLFFFYFFLLLSFFFPDICAAELAAWGGGPDDCIIDHSLEHTHMLEVTRTNQST